MARLPFLESIAFERSHQPFGPDVSASMKLRRKLLHGETLKMSDAEAFGATPGLAYIVVKTMKDWGFQIEDRGAGDTKEFRLLNLQFVPTERVVEAPPKKKRKSPSSTPRASKRKTLPDGFGKLDPLSRKGQFIMKMADGDTVTGADAKRMHLTPSEVKKVMEMWQTAGYTVAVALEDGTAEVQYSVDVKNRIEPEPEIDDDERAYGHPPTTGNGLVPASFPMVPMAPQSGGDWLPAVNGITPVPHLDEGLVVFLTYRDEDGEVRVGIRNGEQSWLCEVVGHVAPQFSAPG